MSNKQIVKQIKLYLKKYFEAIKSNDEWGVEFYKTAAAGFVDSHNVNKRLTDEDWEALKYYRQLLQDGVNHG